MDALSMDALNSRAIEGQGTTEGEWLAWPELDRMPLVSATQLVPLGTRAVVVAPHPDDEVLAVGGLLAQLARAGVSVTVIAVTDGTGSHLGSTEWPVDRLVRERPRESRNALQRLGITVEPVRLGLPDGEVETMRDALADRLAYLLRYTDTVFTTWREDGHPDHEATGAACATAVQRVGARLVEVPVWTWHWAVPGDTRVPWHRASRIALDDDALRRKREAVACFTSQLHPDPSTGRGPILRSTTVARTGRPFEVVFS